MLLCSCKRRRQQRDVRCTLPNSSIVLAAVLGLCFFAVSDLSPFEVTAVAQATKWPIILTTERNNIKNDKNDDIPVEFDCAMRKAAYKFGKQLMPRHKTFLELYYALDLISTDCFVNVTIDLGDEDRDDDSTITTKSPSPLPYHPNTLIDDEDKDEEGLARTDGRQLRGVNKDYLVTVYVDPIQGRDDDDRHHPTPSRSSSSTERDRGGSPLVFQSIQGAIDYAAQFLAGRRAKKTNVHHNGTSSSSTSFSKPRRQKLRAAVLLYSGTYYLDDAIYLTSRHSGIHIMKAAAEEEVIVSGGVQLDSTLIKWTKYEPPHLFRQLGSTKNNIWVADLSDQPARVKTSIARYGVPGLQLNGQRATRARYPNLPRGIEVSCGYGCVLSGDQVEWIPPNNNKESHENPRIYYYVDNTPLHNRSNGGWFEQYMVGINGTCSVYNPPVSYWCSKHPSGGGAFRFKTPSGMRLPSTDENGGSVLPNSIYYNATKVISDAIFFIWRPARWANWMFQVKNYAKEHPFSSSSLSAVNISFGHGGFQGARGEESGGDWFIENLLEELDSPNEYYFDSETMKLYLYYNVTTTASINEDGGNDDIVVPTPPPIDTRFVIPQRRTIVNISGTQWDPIWDVHITGLGFKSSRYTYMDQHGVPSAGDWALERNGAVFLQGTRDTVLRNCIFDRLDGNGIMISGYNRNVKVLDSDFSYIGGTAIASWGYTNETQYDPGRPGVVNDNWPYAGVDGTDGEHPIGTKVIGCTIREVGLYEKQSSFYMQAKTVGTKLIGNVFFNGPRAGINLNDGFGGGDVVSYNLVFSTCRESGDHGPFNSWDRQPFYTYGRRNDTVQPSMIMDWREIHHNFFIDNYSPQEDVDNDDGSAYYHTHDNFLVYGRWGMKNDYGGHSNHHYNNIYAYIQHAFNVCPQIKGREDYFFNNSVIMRGTKLGYVGCDGEGRTIIHDNHYYTPNGTLEECGVPFSEWQRQGHDSGSVVRLHPDHDTIIAWASELLHFDNNDQSGD